MKGNKSPNYAPGCSDHAVCVHSGQSGALWSSILNTTHRLCTQCYINTRTPTHGCMQQCNNQRQYLRLTVILSTVCNCMKQFSFYKQKSRFELLFLKHLKLLLAPGQSEASSLAKSITICLLCHQKAQGICVLWFYLGQSVTVQNSVLSQYTCPRMKLLC